MSWKRLQDKKWQERLKLRSRIIQLIREFFVREDFLEVETPILVPYAGQEPYLDPMRVSFLNANQKMENGYLITSPEYSHKKLLAAGFEKTFEITKCFRGGEPTGGLHNPEFTMIEWYRARADYRDIMQDVEQLVYYVAKPLTLILSPFPLTQPLPFGERRKVRGGEEKGEGGKINYHGRKIDLTPPWQRISMVEAWKKWARVKDPLTDLSDRTNLSRLCRRKGYRVNRDDTYDDLFFKIFLTEIEPKLGFDKPVILYDYPPQMAALARLKSDDRKWAERFEIYIAGMELANAFSELNDATEQRRRFLEEQKLRRKIGKKIIPLDDDFLDAVGHMPLSAGIALGIDRLVMLLTNAAKIEDVMAFPISSMTLA